ncbi:hypothetical protein pb186bvf_015620 [Paramecium bursaria]
MYAPPYQTKPINQLKPLAIIEQDELALLKQKKQDLEMKLKEKEQLLKQNQQQEEPQQQENITPQKQKGKEKKKQQQQQPAQKISLAELKEKEKQEQDKLELKQKIEFLEKEKKAMQQQFEKMKEQIRNDNMNLKEEAVRSKVISDNLGKQVTQIEDDKNQTVKESRKLKQDIRILQDKVLELTKSAAEFEARNKSNKDQIQEREERIKWIDSKLKEEEAKHKQTLGKIIQLNNEINNHKKEIEYFQKDKLRVTLQMEEMIKDHNRKNDDLNEARLKDQREINMLKLEEAEFKKKLDHYSHQIRTLELERERNLQKMEEFTRIEHKLRAREREVVELEIELDRVKRQKGTHIIEKIMEPVAYTQQVIQEVPTPVYDNDIVQLREDILYLQQDRDRALDEADYWRKRYQDLELAGDRNTKLMSHQTLDEIDRSNKVKEQKQELFSKVMALINDISNRKRTTSSFDVKDALEQILNNNNDLLKFLMNQ